MGRGDRGPFWLSRAGGVAGSSEEGRLPASLEVAFSWAVWFPKPGALQRAVRLVGPRGERETPGLKLTVKSEAAVSRLGF